MCYPQAHDIENLKKFLTGKKPHVVAVAGENRYVFVFSLDIKSFEHCSHNGVGIEMLKTCNVRRDAQMIMEDIKRTISELEQESSLPAVGVELVDNELATLYMNSKKSEVNTIHPFHTQVQTHQWFHCLNT